MPNYWLLKSEPSTFSIEDLARSPKRTTCWEGVRNYQARNFLRAMAVGDLAFFYHSNAHPPAIVGIVEIVKAAYPDYFAWRPGSHYFDAKSSKQHPRWVMVDVRLNRALRTPLSLERLRGVSGLEKMELLRRGSRLSVQPVRPNEWKIILQLSRARPSESSVSECMDRTPEG